MKIFGLKHKGCFNSRIPEMETASHERVRSLPLGIFKPGREHCRHAAEVVPPMVGRFDKSAAEATFSCKNI